MYHTNPNEKRSVEINMKLFKVFKFNSAYELGTILEEFQRLRDRLNSTIGAIANRIEAIDSEIANLEVEAFNEGLVRDKILKVLKNSEKVSDV